MARMVGPIIKLPEPWLNNNRTAQQSEGGKTVGIDPTIIAARNRPNPESALGTCSFCHSGCPKTF